MCSVSNKRAAGDVCETQRHISDCMSLYVCAARATSGLLVMLSRHLGGLWGTLLGMAIYFIALYCAFMLITVR
jgi:hypothetical protein